MGGRGSSSGKSGASGGSAASSARTVAPTTSQKQPNLMEQAASGSLSTARLNKMDKGSKAVMMNNMPVGTKISRTVGGKTTEYTKRADGKWQPAGSANVLDRTGRKPAVTASSISGVDFKTVKYPKRR